MRGAIESKRPYLLRALHEWMTDNNETPLIVVDAGHAELVAPGEYADNGQLILNISYSATGALRMENDIVSFNARFNGQPMNLQVPVEAIMAIYSRESGEGMVFAVSGEELEVSREVAGSKPTAQPAKSSRPNLTVVK